MKTTDPKRLDAGEHPTMIYFGLDLLAQCSALLQPLQQNARYPLLLICSPGIQTRPWFAKLDQELSAVQAGYKRFYVPPFFDKNSLFTLQNQHPQGALIVACGGGSVMDAAKILRQLYTKKGIDCPLVNWPSTSGSGSEVTPFAAFWSQVPPKKHSLECDYPSLACVDPQLALSQPATLRLSCGLDAIIQALEALWNRHVQKQSSHWALQALQLAIPALSLLQKPSGIEIQTQELAAQSDLSHASLLSGLAISYTRTALCHSLSYPLSAHLGIPHGLACAFSLPEVWQFNLEFADAAFAEKLHFIETLLHAQALRSQQRIPEGLNFPERLSLLWHAWLETLKLPEQLSPYFENCTKQQAQHIQQELYAPERASRNLRPATAQDLQKLFDQSLQRWHLNWPLEKHV